MSQRMNDEYSPEQLTAEYEFGNMPDFPSEIKPGGYYEEEQKIPPAPKCSNTRKARKKKRMKRKARRRIAIIIILLLILSALCGRFIYNRFIAPPTLDRYMECFENGDYETCAAIAKKLSHDSDFTDAIKKPVQKEASAAYNLYMTAEADSAETLDKLETLDKASAGLFADSIGGQIAKVKEMDALYQSISSVNALVRQGNMEGLGEAYEILAGAKEKGAALGINPDWMLNSVIKDNIEGLKYYLFSRYADELQLGRSGYAFIEESAAFINSYAADPDLENYLSVMSGLQKGWHSPIYAADEAKKAAAAAEEKWREAIGN